MMFEEHGFDGDARRGQKQNNYNTQTDRALSSTPGEPACACFAYLKTGKCHDRHHRRIRRGARYTRNIANAAPAYHTENSQISVIHVNASQMDRRATDYW